MRKFICILGVILSIALLTVGVNELLGDVLSIRPYTAYAVPDYEDELLTGSAAETLSTHRLGLFQEKALHLALAASGLFGLLLSVYGFCAAGVSSKQLKLLKQIAGNLEKNGNLELDLLRQIADKKLVVTLPAAAAPREEQPAPRREPVREEKPAPAVNIAKAPRKDTAPRAAASGEWRCPVCAMENQANARQCVCCNEPRPADGGSFARPASGTWVCPTCGMSNNPSAKECAVCGEKRP